jgi:excisionase family DNA binding protein
VRSILGLSRQTVERMIKSGKLERIYIGRCVLIPRESVQRLVHHERGITCTLHQSRKEQDENARLEVI